MILTEQEIDDLSREMVKGYKSVNWLAKKIESAVLEKLKAQEPVAHVVEHEGGTTDYVSATLKDCFLRMNKGWAVVSNLYEHPLPPADVVRDAERLDWIQANCRCDPMMDGQHKWWPTNFNKCLTGPSIRVSFDVPVRIYGLFGKSCGKPIVQRNKCKG